MWGRGWDGFGDWLVAPRLSPELPHVQCFGCWYKIISLPIRDSWAVCGRAPIALQAFACHLGVKPWKSIQCWCYPNQQEANRWYLAWYVLVAILGRTGKENSMVSKHEGRPLQDAKAFQSP